MFTALANLEPLTPNFQYASCSLQDCTCNSRKAMRGAVIRETWLYRNLHSVWKLCEHLFKTCQLCDSPIRLPLALSLYSQLSAINFEFNKCFYYPQKWQSNSVKLTEKSAFNWNHHSICVLSVPHHSNQKGPEQQGYRSTNTSITDSYLLMSQQTRNQQRGGDRMTETETVTQPVKQRREKYKEEASDEGRERWRGERQELVDSCWSVYFDDIALLQMFSSTQRKREREREREGQGRRMWVMEVRWRLPGWTHHGVFYDLHIQSATWWATRSQW